MAISMYDFSIPDVDTRPDQFVGASRQSGRACGGEEIRFCRARTVTIVSRHASLGRQVQIACDTAKGAAARLAGIEVPKHEDTETTLPELKARIAKTLDFLKSVTAAQMKDEETRAIEIKFPNGAWKFTALGYLTDFVLPNFYFHVSIVYALLRKGGVEVGKRDFLGAIQ